jgi:hypothetical protein
MSQSNPKSAAPVLDIKYNPLTVKKEIQIEKKSFAYIFPFFFLAILTSVFLIFAGFLIVVGIPLLAMFLFGMTVIGLKIRGAKQQYIRAKEGKRFQLFNDRLEFWRPNLWGTCAKRTLFLKDIKEIMIMDDIHHLYFIKKNKSELILSMDHLLAKDEDIIKGLHQVLPELVQIPTNFIVS